MVNKPATKRKRLSVEARRRQLEGVGVELIADRAWSTLTMADIAAAADVSKPLLYHYFSTKHDLYIAAVRAAADQLSEITRPDPTLPGRAGTRQALAAHVDFVEAHSLHYCTLLNGAVSGDPEVREIIDASHDETVRRILGNLGTTEPSPTLRIALRGWIGFLDAACVEWLTDPAITKAQLVELLAASLPGSIRLAKNIDRQAQEHPHD